MPKRINLVFTIFLSLFVLIIVGILPRTSSIFLASGLAVYFLLVPLEEAVLFFVRSIPFFVALPLTANFDSLNMWRIFSAVLFLRWLTFEKIKWFFTFNKSRKVYLVLLLLFILAVVSVFQAADPLSSLKRIAFLINMSLIGIIVYDIVLRDRGFSKKVIPNIAIPAIIVSLFGLLQLATTYLMDIYQFVDFWGNVVERNLFGNAWADIALKANTWFAYFGDQLSLRMFSIFPDSHSYPMFLIFGLPAIFALSLFKIIDAQKGLKSMILTRGRMVVLAVPIAFLGVILSGTRGMWASGLGTVIWAVFLAFWHRRLGIENHRSNTFKYVSFYLSIFILLFAVAYPIIASPQFLVSKLGSSQLNSRIRSIIDFGETSNSRRIQIWKDSLVSIARHPLTGIGINNFPVVVNEGLERIKAGSSAHNLYLHIAAEMGIPALIAMLYFLWLLLKKCFDNFRSETDPLMLVYFSALLLFVPWNLMYLMTDVAIFDERVFLLFSVTAGLIFAYRNRLSTN